MSEKQLKRPLRTKKPLAVQLSDPERWLLDEGARLRGVTSNKFTLDAAVGHAKNTINFLSEDSREFFLKMGEGIACLVVDSILARHDPERTRDEFMKSLGPDADPDPEERERQWQEWRRSQPPVVSDVREVEDALLAGGRLINWLIVQRLRSMVKDPRSHLFMSDTAP